MLLLVLWLLMATPGLCQPSRHSRASARAGPYTTRTLVPEAHAWQAGQTAIPSGVQTAARQRCLPLPPSPFALPTLHQLTYLEGRSVKPATYKDYHRRALAFVQWATAARQAWENYEQLDLCLVLFLDKLFFGGYTGDDASKLVAAVKFFYPDLGRWGAGALPRTSRALAGWGKVVPRRSRMPLPWVLLAAIIGVLLRRGLVEHAVALLVSFVAYLRPGECDSLTSLQLVAPVAAAGGAADVWGLLLAPVELGNPSKTNSWDDAVLLDSIPYVYPCLQVLKRRCWSPTDRIWSYPPGDLSIRLAEAAAELQLTHLGITLYGLRHGGVSHDILHRLRTPLEAKLRMRVASDSTLKRYAKQTRVVSELGRAPPLVVAFGNRVSALLAAVFAGTASVPSPPGLPGNQGALRAG